MSTVSGLASTQAGTAMPKKKEAPMMMMLRLDCRSTTRRMEMPRPMRTPVRTKAMPPRIGPGTLEKKAATLPRSDTTIRATPATTSTERLAVCRQGARNQSHRCIQFNMMMTM